MYTVQSFNQKPLKAQYCHRIHLHDGKLLTTAVLRNVRVYNNVGSYVAALCLVYNYRYLVEDHVTVDS